MSVQESGRLAEHAGSETAAAPSETTTWSGHGICRVARLSVDEGVGVLADVVAILVRHLQNLQFLRRCPCVHGKRSLNPQEQEDATTSSADSQSMPTARLRPCEHSVSSPASRQRAPAREAAGEFKVNQLTAPRHRSRPRRAPLPRTVAPSSQLSATNFWPRPLAASSVTMPCRAPARRRHARNRRSR